MAKKTDIKTVRLKSRAYKATASIAVVLFLFYLVLYLKESGFTGETYFANYENAVTVWVVGLDFFKTIMNTLDSLTTVLGKIFDFIVNSVDAIISYIQDLISAFESSAVGSWLDGMREWFKDIWGNLIPWTGGNHGL